ncbi:MAG: hypothetical protein EA379_01105 [Phycisphaerales bacterium]|nr:MAG: hypothetical protein EA379_01105 [Phycisphaerales bacterium]
MAEIARELQERLRAEDEGETDEAPEDDDAPAPAAPAAKAAPAPEPVKPRARESSPTAVRSEAIIRDKPPRVPQQDDADAAPPPPKKPAPIGEEIKKADAFDPDDAASLDEELAGAVDIAGDFEDVDAAIGAIFDTRASAVQRGADPAEVRDFAPPERDKKKARKGGGVRFAPPAADEEETTGNEPAEEIDSDEAVAERARMRADELEAKQNAPPTFEVEESAAGALSDADRFSAFEAMPLHEAETVDPGPLVKALVLVNKPLADAGLALRSTIGLAAVMTLFNAACLWIWIIIR